MRRVRNRWGEPVFEFIACLLQHARDRYYIAADEAFTGRLERLHGEHYAMAGGSPAHAQLIATLQGLMFLALRGGPCRSTSSEQRVLLPNDDAAYPDLTVWCGTPTFRDGKTLTNPTVIVEVLSPSTEGWDRVGKLDLYPAGC